MTFACFRLSSDVDSDLLTQTSILTHPWPLDRDSAQAVVSNCPALHDAQNYWTFSTGFEVCSHVSHLSHYVRNSFKSMIQTHPEVQLHRDDDDDTLR